MSLRPSQISAALIFPFCKWSKPEDKQDVIWIFGSSGQVTAGDYYKGKPRDAGRNYEDITGVKPSHWMPWPGLNC